MKINGFTLIMISAFAVGVIYALGKSSKKINPKGKKILFVGDSHTALTSQPLENTKQYKGEGWQSYLARIYGFNEINISEGGRASKYMIDKFQTYLKTHSTPDVCFFYLGANDAYSPVTNEQVIKNLQFMIDTCNEKGIVPVIITGYNSRSVIVNNPRIKPFGTNTQQSLWNMGEKRYQQQLTFNQLKNAIIVPIYNDILPTDASDGYHLGAKKQQQFAKFIAPYVFV
jgi:lysophospholipase L1-like esterase